MPIYEYLCNACKENFALLIWASTEERPSTCPKCGSPDVKKLLSPFSCSPSGDPGSGGSSNSGFSGGG
jgi:putative FmdB family regulatory protein